MTANPEFEDMLDDWLQVIDRNLALDGAALTTRPLDAACQFVRFAIKQIRIGDVESKPGTCCPADHPSDVATSVDPRA